MSFIDEIKEKVKGSMKTIVLPESTDIRVLEAARKITDEGFAKVVLIGNKDELQNIAGSIDLSDITIIDPATAPIVKRVFDLYLQGKTFLQISNIFNEEKVLNKNWKDTHIERIINTIPSIRIMQRPV